MKLLNKILGINLPTVEDIKAQVANTEEVKQPPTTSPSILAYIHLALAADGNVMIKTEWANESKELASVYAQLIYQINSGSLEDGILDVLFKFGNEHLQSQEFIGNVVKELKDLQVKYKHLPIIKPTKALAVTEKS